MGADPSGTTPRPSPPRASLLRGVRSTILAATLVPIVGLVVLAAVAIGAAEDARRTTGDLADRIRGAVTVAEVEMAVRAEVGVYRGWIAGRPSAGDALAGATEALDIEAALAAQLRRVTDDALADLAGRPRLQDEVGGATLADRLAAARAAYTLGDPVELGRQIDAVRAVHLDALMVNADPATVEGAELVRLAALTAPSRSLIEEGSFLTEALIAGWLTDSQLAGLSAAIERTDRSVDELAGLIAAETEPQRQEIERRMSDGSWASVRRAALDLPRSAADRVAPDPLGLLGLISGGTEMTEALLSLGDAVADQRLAALDADVERAEQRRNALVVASLVVVVGSVVFAARYGGRLSRRLLTLHRITDRLRRGDLSPPDESVAPGRHDEIDDLAKVVDDLRTTVGLTLAAVDSLADGSAVPAVLDAGLPGATGANLATGIQRLEASTTELRRRADRDALTDLIGRAAFERHLQEIADDGLRACVFFVDLDDFKPINDSFGHDAGDAVLRTIGRRLDRLCRETDLAARLGGDEFGLAVLGVRPQTAEEMSERLRRAVTQPVAIESDLTVRVGVSVGMAVMEPDASVDEVIRRADAAMYVDKQAKSARRTLDPSTRTADR